MTGIVEDALSAAQDHTVEEEADQPADDGFGWLQPVFIGCGTDGARTAAQGWDSRQSSVRYPDASTVAIGATDQLPMSGPDHFVQVESSDPQKKSIAAAIPECDYAVLTVDLGTLADIDLVWAVVDALPANVTNIAIPIIPLERARRRECREHLATLVATVDTTIPCDLRQLPGPVAALVENDTQTDRETIRTAARSLIRELATDLVMMGSAHVSMSPPAGNLWDALEAGGLTAGFRGSQTEADADRSATGTADRLVRTTANRPFTTDTATNGGAPATPVGGDVPVTCLLGGPDITLSDADAVRNAVATRFGETAGNGQSNVFTVESIANREQDYRMTTLVTGIDLEHYLSTTL